MSFFFEQKFPFPLEVKRKSTFAPSHSLKTTCKSKQNKIHWKVKLLKNKFLSLHAHPLPKSSSSIFTASYRNEGVCAQELFEAKVKCGGGGGREEEMLNNTETNKINWSDTLWKNLHTFHTKAVRRKERRATPALACCLPHFVLAMCWQCFR